MYRLALAASLAGLLATAAVAQTELQSTEPSSTNPPASTAEADAGKSDSSKVVCKTVKPPTGTRVGSSRSRTRICMTKGEWDEQARAAQEELKVRDRGICSPGECSG